MKFSRLSLFIVAALAVALAACGGGSSGGAAQPSTGKTINVEANEFAFNPATFSGTVGEPINFKITNKGTVIHNFVILNTDGSQELAKIEVKVGSSAILVFTPPAAGDYLVDCNLPGHKEAGMRGKLIVK